MEAVAAVVVASPAAVLALLILVARLMRRTPAAMRAMPVPVVAASAVRASELHDGPVHPHWARHATAVSRRRCRTDSRDRASLA